MQSLTRYNVVHMGFPPWTLWGMGLSAAAALITIALAFIAQTPRLLARLGLVGARLDLRARSLTGYGLAFLLLAMGFFIAGVPLGTQPAAVAAISTGEPLVAGTIVAEGMDQDGPVATAPGEEGTLPESEPAATRPPTTGAMGGLVAPAAEASPVPATAEDPATEEAGPSPTTPPELLGTQAAPVAGTLDGTPEPTATSEPTATPQPTQTPTATPTPTPIIGPTARINDNTSTLSIRRTPGGDPLVQVVRGDTVLLLSGHAFYGGALWREVSTVDGVYGWVQEQFLDYLDSSS